MPKTGITIPSRVGIGDHIQFACVPENYYRNKGEKLVDVNRCYIFDHNPYVVREDNKPDRGLMANVIDLWAGPTNWACPRWPRGIDFLSKSERWCAGLGLEKCYLRHPRLYVYEKTFPNKNPTVSFHCTGTTRGSLSDEAIETIQKNYEGFEVIQVGGLEDKPTPFTDKRGLSFFESAKIIANSQVFVGIDSGMYHVARCYPNVRKKIVIEESHMDEARLKSFVPFTEGYEDWLDFDTEFYNKYDYDIGITMALKKV